MNITIKSPRGPVTNGLNPSRIDNVRPGTPPKAPPQKPKTEGKK